jgi:hypothetical protein
MLLSRSRRARIRVRVSDGFNEGRATSGLFTAVGRAPLVKILSPRARTKVAADGVLSLTGQAYDDRGDLVSDRHLVWYAGRKRVGRGARLTLSGFTPGRLRLRLLARVRGSTGSARVTVRVTRAVPRILALKTPAHISIHATSVSIRIAATLPARLSAGGRHFTVSRAVKAIKIPVKPGTGRLALKLTLTAAGLRSTTLLLLPRQ